MIRSKDNLWQDGLSLATPRMRSKAMWITTTMKTVYKGQKLLWKKVRKEEYFSRIYVPVSGFEYAVKCGEEHGY